MKKTFAAVLAAVVCPAAMAQSSLTLSGVMDMGMSYRSGDAQSRISTRSGGQSVSRWTLRGSEDLGGGMTAFFNLTNVFNAGTGKSAFDGRLFNGAAYVGLRASAGELRLGRQAVFGGAWGSWMRASMAVGPALATWSCRPGMATWGPAPSSTSS